jgi:pimeloyl-ACP methyl ester carboxylesterase
MATRESHAGEPRLLLQLLEPRALLEAAALPWLLPALALAPRGDGHPVLLLPGFMADEATLVALKLFLENRGYEVQTWGFGRNVGFTSRHAKALEQKIRYMHYRSGRKVSLVGWSLGGMFAMYGAHEAPECIRSVITLGSPVTIDPAGSQSMPLIKALYRLVAHPMGTAAHATHRRAKTLRLPKALPAPITCIYSLTDGVVPPQEATIDGVPGLHENVRVPGSHLGLGFNSLVLWIVADRLAQPEGEWRPFEPAGVSGRLYRWMTSGFASAWRDVEPGPLPSASPSPSPARVRGSPGRRRAGTARRPRGRASARGRTSARR